MRPNFFWYVISVLAMVLFNILLQKWGQVNFLHQQLSESFYFFSLKDINLEVHFLLKSDWKTVWLSFFIDPSGTLFKCMHSDNNANTKLWPDKILARLNNLGNLVCRRAESIVYFHLHLSSPFT